MFMMRISIGKPTSALLPNNPPKSTPPATVLDHLLAILVHIISRLCIEVIYQGLGKFNCLYEIPIRLWYLIFSFSLFVMFFSDIFG